MLPPVSRKRKGSHGRPSGGSGDNTCTSAARQDSASQQRPTKHSRLADAVPPQSDRNALRPLPVVGSVVKPEPSGARAETGVGTRSDSIQSTIKSEKHTAESLARHSKLNTRSNKNGATHVHSAMYSSASMKPQNHGKLSGMKHHQTRHSGHKRPLSTKRIPHGPLRGQGGQTATGSQIYHRTAAAVAAGSRAGVACATLPPTAAGLIHPPPTATAAAIAVPVPMHVAAAAAARNAFMSRHHAHAHARQAQLHAQQRHFAVTANNAHAHALAHTYQIARSHTAAAAHVQISMHQQQAPHSQTLASSVHRRNSAAAATAAAAASAGAMQHHHRHALSQTLQNSSNNSNLGKRPAAVPPPAAGSLFAAVSNGRHASSAAKQHDVSAHHGNVTRAAPPPHATAIAPPRGNLASNSNSNASSGSKHSASARGFAAAQQSGGSTTPDDGNKSVAAAPPSPPLERLLTASAMKLIALDRRNKKSRESEAARLAAYYREWKVHVTSKPRDVNLYDSPSPLVIYGTGSGALSGIRLEVCASYKGSRVDSVLVDWHLDLLFDDYTPVKTTDEVLSVVRRRYNMRTMMWHITVNLHDVAQKNTHRRFLIKVFANSMIFESISDKYIGSYVGPFTVKQLDPSPSVPLVSPPLMPSGSHHSPADAMPSIAPPESSVISLSQLNVNATTQPQIHHSDGFIENALLAKQRADIGGHQDFNLQRLRQLNRVEMLIREQSELLRSISDVAHSLNSYILHPAPPVHELPPAAHRRNSVGNNARGSGSGSNSSGCHQRHHRAPASPNAMTDYDSILPPPPFPPPQHYAANSSSGSGNGNSSTSAAASNNPVAPPPSLGSHPPPPRLPTSTPASASSKPSGAHPPSTSPPSFFSSVAPPPLDHLPGETA